MFHAVEFDACPAYGWQGGPTAFVLIKTLANRYEKRDRQGSLMQHSFTLPFQNIAGDEYLAYIKSAFMAMGGPTDSFLVKDYGDFQTDLEPLGITPAGSTPVQLLKSYTFGDASFTRPITKPVTGAIIYQNAIAKAGTLDTSTGLFTPTTNWTGSAVLTWSGEFRVPVRFNTFFLPATLDSRVGSQYAVNSSVELLEVFGE